MNTMNAARSQKLKLLLVPILALVLGAVVFWPAADERPEVEPVAESQHAAAATSISIGAAPNAELWKGVDLSKAAEINPFAGMRAVSTIAQGDSDSSAETSTLEASATHVPAKRIIRSVSAIVQRDGKAYACIDNEVAAVGDTLPDGARVISITDETVVLEAPQ